MPNSKLTNEEAIAQLVNHGHSGNCSSEFHDALSMGIEALEWRDTVNETVQQLAVESVARWKAHLKEAVEKKFYSHEQERRYKQGVWYNQALDDVLKLIDTV